MSLLKKIPLWLYSGILYGLSWPIFEGINLSFLAWFAFVPLFIFLEKNQYNFWKSMRCCYAAMVVFGFFSAGWLFNFPQSKFQIALIFFFEEFWLFIPFLILFPIQKGIGFQKTLWIFPFIWMIWEWIYLGLEFTMGTHLSAYSQSNNIWLIQYIDTTGIWGVSFWLMLFNVLLYKTYRNANYKLKTKSFIKKTVLICAFMVGIPLCYAAFAYASYPKEDNKTISVTVIPTKFTPRYLLNPANQYSVVEQTLYKTDQFAFKMKEQQKYPDLYVWPETGLTLRLQDSNLSPLLNEAVQDWEAALITGGTSEVFTSYYKKYVSGVLISHKDSVPKRHFKTRLIPGQEAIPYHSLLLKIPNFPILQSDGRFYDKGMNSKPLEMTTKNNHSFLVGVSLCYEQWYPKHWAALARNGAEFYTHLAAEGWYGKSGFMTFMVNVTRMRSIENRKQTARSANVGISCFIDQLGRIEKNKYQKYAPINKSLTAIKGITFYAKYPNFFPAIGLSVLLILTLTQFINIKNH